MQEAPRSSNSPRPVGWGQRLVRLASDPTARFFAIGALLFVVHRLVTGDERTIVVTPGVKADVERKFRDHQHRAPTPAELQQALGDWKEEEALYREALIEELDRDDPTIRSVLADKMRARAALGVVPRKPSDAEIERFFAAHPELYAGPRRYDYESVTFPKSDADAAEQRAAFERALTEGKDARTLGRPIVGGKPDADTLRRRVGEPLSALIMSLPPGRWERAENDAGLLLVRLKGVESGVLPLAQLRPRVIADLLAAERQQAVDRAAEAVVQRFHFEEPK